MFEIVFIVVEDKESVLDPELLTIPWNCEGIYSSGFFIPSEFETGAVRKIKNVLKNSCLRALTKVSI